MNKEATSDLVKDFVIAGHGNLPRVRELLETNPELLNMDHAWSETDRETAIQAAAQVGNASIAEYLLSKGAPLSISTAAMLDKKKEVQRMLSDEPTRINATGAHGIPLLTHACWSKDLEMVKLLYQKGATTGASSGLFNSIAKGSEDVTLWLLENASPDLKAKNFQGKTALQIALEKGDRETALLLQSHGAEG